MEIIKEKIREALENNVTAHDFDGSSVIYVEEAIFEIEKIINQEQQGYTFPRVPNKVKLSDLKERLENSIGWNLIIEKENNCIGLCLSMNGIEHAEVYIKDNKILWTDIAKQVQPNTKWVEEYKIAETYIEVDV